MSHSTRTPNQSIDLTSRIYQAISDLQPTLMIRLKEMGKSILGSVSDSSQDRWPFGLEGESLENLEFVSKELGWKVGAHVNKEALLKKLKEAPSQDWFEQELAPTQNKNSTGSAYSLLTSASGENYGAFGRSEPRKRSAYEHKQEGEVKISENDTQTIDMKRSEKSVTVKELDDGSLGVSLVFKSKC